MNNKPETIHLVATNKNKPENVGYQLGIGSEYLKRIKTFEHVSSVLYLSPRLEDAMNFERSDYAVALAEKIAEKEGQDVEVYRGNVVYYVAKFKKFAFADEVALDRI
jgi:hypothetical protein